MVQALNQAGWDALAWNYRSCSGEINRTLRFYHNGSTDDLAQVIDVAINKDRYREIALIGFSMGGNLSLMYLGEYQNRLDDRIRKAVVFSVPCHLKSSARMLARPGNKFYMKRFLKQLHKKIQQKMILFPDRINDQGYELIKNFKDFDDRYTAPIHGFRNAEDYWNQCSSLQYIDRIGIRTLMINAANDPFLGRECYPVEQAKQNNYVKLEIPASGGHVGFVAFNPERIYWSEMRTRQFLNE
jgi:predicted alpha/beta-fold hydrolase